MILEERHIARPARHTCSLSRSVKRICARASLHHAEGHRASVRRERNVSRRGEERPAAARRPVLHEGEHEAFGVAAPKRPVRAANPLCLCIQSSSVCFVLPTASEWGVTACAVRSATQVLRQRGGMQPDASKQLINTTLADAGNRALSALPKTFQKTIRTVQACRKSTGLLRLQLFRADPATDRSLQPMGLLTRWQLCTYTGMPSLTQNPTAFVHAFGRRSASQTENCGASRTRDKNDIDVACAAVAKRSAWRGSCRSPFSVPSTGSFASGTTPVRLCMPC